ncbi:MAG TPA: FAD-binding oxidoreductase [Anaerolineales bacterium]|nr:FAD-binding oxidoreductase [Anaerolineales bacterium]
MTLSFNNFLQLENFGHSLRAPSYRFRPTSTEEIYEVFHLAKETGLTVTARGAGKSYNDASLNGGGIMLETSAMNQILEWDSVSGVVRCEPGVTLEQLWKYIEPNGWWPPVVSGTMKTTLGGCLAANIHGKNNFQKGTIGEHVLEFSAMLPTGELITCTPEQNSDLFYAMISGLGMLGVFTSIIMQMKRVHSGLMSVDAWSVPNLNRHLRDLLDKAPHYDYIVGWLDTTADGKNLGRGQIHAANNLKEGEDPDARETMRLENQTLPPRIFGVMPKSLLHYFMRPFMINLGAWGINTAKYISSIRRHTFRQSHAAFHFLLDYVPDWELAYGRGGLIQYQSFLPKETAEETWREMIQLSLRRGLPSYLGVTKRHRPDKFLLTHALDGFSLAMDFKVTDSRRAKLSQMLQDFDRIVLDAGGRFYFAKNSETSAAAARTFLGEETLLKFKELKKRCDPDNILESDLFRRVFG